MIRTHSNLPSVEVVPPKAWEPRNHPNLTDVSLRHVGWFGGGWFAQFPTGSRLRELVLAQTRHRIAAVMALSAAVTRLCRLLHVHQPTRL